MTVIGSEQAAMLAAALIAFPAALARSRPRHAALVRRGAVGRFVAFVAAVTAADRERVAAWRTRRRLARDSWRSTARSDPGGPSDRADEPPAG